MSKRLEKKVSKIFQIQKQIGIGLSIFCENKKAIAENYIPQSLFLFVI
ncbi:hypothetical protein FEM21_11570 [Flavobacterium seoulense]|uniref:Uncharacterized protein n=1 Tax=Flavobacterium seoulense TaxID=1492738 RepID=A0A066WPH6_9FLAO|nr:hypothetical protein FEM21_11570 [Flavobacterium seoulense]